MKTKRKTDYKSFTPLRCKCCNNYIDEDIHDSLCLDCLDAAFPLETDKDDYELVENFMNYKEIEE